MDIMQTLMHFIGFCPDAYCHPNLWIVIMSGGGMFPFLHRWLCHRRCNHVHVCEKEEIH